MEPVGLDGQIIEPVEIDDTQIVAQSDIPITEAMASLIEYKLCVVAKIDGELHLIKPMTNNSSKQQRKAHKIAASRMKKTGLTHFVTKLAFAKTEDKDGDTIENKSE